MKQIKQFFLKSQILLILFTFSCTTVSLEGDWMISQTYTTLPNGTMKSIPDPFSWLKFTSDSIWIDGVGTSLTKKNEGDGNHLIFNWENIQQDFLIKDISTDGLILESSKPFEANTTVFILKR